MLLKFLVSRRFGNHLFFSTTSWRYMYFSISLSPDGARCPVSQVCWATPLFLPPFPCYKRPCGPFGSALKTKFHCDRKQLCALFLMVNFYFIHLGDFDLIWHLCFLSLPMQIYALSYGEDMHAHPIMMFVM